MIILKKKLIKSIKKFVRKYKKGLVDIPPAVLLLNLIRNDRIN